MTEMSDDRRAVLIRPGDLLILGNTGTLDAGAHQSLMVVLSEIKEALDLAGVIVFQENVDLAIIDAEQIEQLMARQVDRRRRRTVTGHICGQGTGGGEVCMRPEDHDGGHDPDSTEVTNG